MTPIGIHRIVEHQAAARPDAVAILAGAVTLTYREVNQRANTLARRLGRSGLTRGTLALVRLERSADLAVVLLGVLKAGAAYAWVEPDSAHDLEMPASFCIVPSRSGADSRYLAVDLSHALKESAERPGPNLPIVARGADVACVLLDGHGSPHVLVPHATIAALPRIAAGPRAAWGPSPGAFDLWVGLMSGATLTLDVRSETTAAA